jgi:excisionase family DNA binding protein
MTSPQLLTVPEVAKRLRVSEKTVRRRIKSGHLKATRVGPRSVRVAEPDLARYVYVTTPPF